MTNGSRRTNARLLGALFAAISCAPSAPPTLSEAELPRIDEALHAELAPKGGAAEGGTVLTRIHDPSTLCMLSGRYFGKPQVPAQVGEHTYYGCCSGCAARLASQPEARVAHDPVSGREVDKARAVLAYGADRRVLYFESEATLAAYATR